MVEPGATAEVPYLGGGGAFLKSLSGRSTDFCLKKSLALDADPEAKEAASWHTVTDNCECSDGHTATPQLMGLHCIAVRTYLHKYLTLMDKMRLQNTRNSAFC